MQASHARSAVSAGFDDPNLVSCAGLVPVLALAESCGLAGLVGDKLSVASPNARLKVPALVAGMVAGADSIEDMDLLRHGGMDRLFDGVRAPSTLGTFLRTFTFGHVRQLDSVAADLLVALAKRTPLLAAGEAIAYVDIDDTIRATYGYAKQGAGYGYSKVKGINALLATISTPTAAPVIAATRLRKGSTNPARGAARLLADALATAARAGVGALVIVRADSAYYNRDVIAAATRAGARFSVTARMDPAVRRAIAGIDEAAWTPIHYPNAIWDADEQRLIPDAEVAETAFTAFTSRRKADHVDARLIVRRVKRLNPKTVPPGQDAGVRDLPPCSPTHPCSWATPRRATASTRSSNRSTPTSRAAPWPTCPPGSSPRTPPGWCRPRLRSTSPAPPAPSPRASTPAPPAPPSEASSSPCPPGWPAPDAGSGCTCPPPGPGARTGNNSSTRCTDHRAPPDPRRPPAQRPRSIQRGRAGQTGSPAAPETGPTITKINTTIGNDHTNSRGGSGFRRGPDRL